MSAARRGRYGFNECGIWKFPLLLTVVSLVTLVILVWRFVHRAAIKAVL